MDRTNLLVIGAGLSRTGTSSLKVALEQLLGGPCYHGSVPTSTHPHHLQVWENARESGRLDDKVARSVLTGYLAAVDWPANFWHRELAEIFPHAKVVLTVRDARAWYRSVSTLQLYSIHSFEPLLLYPSLHNAHCAKGKIFEKSTATLKILRRFYSLF